MSVKETIFSFDPQGTLLTAIQGPPENPQVASPAGAVHATAEVQQPHSGPATELPPLLPRQVGAASHSRENQEPEGSDVSYMSVAGLVGCITSYLLTHLLALVILRFI